MTSQFIVSPSDRLGALVSPDLAKILMRCLAKVPELRFPSAAAMDQALSECAEAGTWTPEKAEKWWKANMNGIEVLPVTKMAEKTLVIAERA